MRLATVLCLLAGCFATQVVHAAQSGAPAIQNPRVTCDRWPNNYDAKSWMADVLRIENAQTEEQKAIALYKWVRLQLHWGDQCYDGTRGTCVVEMDAIKKINYFQYGFCVDFGLTSAALGHAGGMKALEAHVPAHTELEVVYKDADGIERNHRFDPFWGIAVYDKTGSHIATWQEIKADPTIASQATKTLLPWGDKKGDRERFADKGACQPSLRVRPSLYTMDKPLYPGETYTLSWDAASDAGFVNANPELKDNMNCWGFLRFIYADGKLENLKYGHEALRPYLTVQGDQIQVRPAHGRLNFAPLLNKDFADSLYAPAQNVATEASGSALLHPEKAGAPAVLIYAVRTPYVISFASFSGKFRAGAEDSVKVSVANADWRTRDYTTDQVLPANPQWRTVWASSGSGEQTMALKAADLKLRGEYQYLVKVEMNAAKDPRSVGIESLAFDTTFQENPLALPRLLPGKNTITLSAGEVRPGYVLRVSYLWDDAKAKDRKDVKTADRFPFSYEIAADGREPNDVRTHSVMLEAVKK